jgi:hypothetical protein
MILVDLVLKFYLVYCDNFFWTTQVLVTTQSSIHSGKHELIRFCIEEVLKFISSYHNDSTH